MKILQCTTKADISAAVLKRPNVKARVQYLIEPKEEIVVHAVFNDQSGHKYLLLANESGWVQQKVVEPGSPGDCPQCAKFANVDTPVQRARAPAVPGKPVEQSESVGSAMHTDARDAELQPIDHISLAQLQQMKLKIYGPFGRHRNTTSSPVVSQCARASTVLASAPVGGSVAETPLVPHTSTVPTVSNFFERAAAALPTTPTVFEPVHTAEKHFKDCNSFIAEAMRSYKSESESEVAEYDTDDAADDAEMLMYRADDDAYYNRYQLNQSRPMHNPPHHNPAVQASWCTYCGKWYCTCSSACADSSGTSGGLPSWM